MQFPFRSSILAPPRAKIKKAIAWKAKWERQKRKWQERERKIERDHTVRRSKSEQESSFMPKFKAIGAISETIVLTNTPTSRAPQLPLFPSPAVLSEHHHGGLGFLIYPGSYLNSRISASPPPSQFRPSPSALSVFQSFLWTRLEHDTR